MTQALIVIYGLLLNKEMGEPLVNIVEKLLKMDAGKIEMPTKVITIQAKKLGQPIEFPCKAVDPEKFAEIQENSLVMKKGDVKKVESYKLKTLTIIEGCPEVFKSKEVMGHFGAPTPKDLVKKLLLSGEIQDLYDAICELSGYDPDKEDKDEEEIKNSLEKVVTSE
jgi:hypothetical protein